MPLHRRPMRFLSTVMVSVLVITAILGGFASQSYAAPSGPWDKPVSSHRPGDFPGRGPSRVEIGKWQAANSRHFLNRDGTFTAEAYDEDVSYQDPATRTGSR